MTKKANNFGVDDAFLHEKAMEYAKKGAEQAIKEYYCGYDSPYVKELKQHFSKNKIEGITLPSIVVELNKAISQEFDMIANNVMAKSLIPSVQEVFAEPRTKFIKFSEILQKFILCTSASYQDTEIEIKDFGHNSKNVFLKSIDAVYDFTLFKQNNGNFTLYGVPNYKDKSSYFGQRKMKLKLENGASLEMPFTPNIMQDSFMSYLANIMIYGCEIELDDQDFTEDMFANCECEH